MSADASIDVRVGVPEMCDTVKLSVSPTERIENVKQAALDESLGRRVDPVEYVVKFRGAAVTDEAITLQKLGVPNGGTFVVIQARRRPVRS